MLAPLSKVSPAACARRRSRLRLTQCGSPNGSPATRRPPGLSHGRASSRGVLIGYRSQDRGREGSVEADVRIGQPLGVADGGDDVAEAARAGAARGVVAHLGLQIDDVQPTARREPLATSSVS